MKTTKTMLLTTCVAAVIALAGCRAEEQGRISNFEPGVYKGPEDQALGENVLQDLRGRASYQRME